MYTVGSETGGRWTLRTAALTVVVTPAATLCRTWTDAVDVIGLATTSSAPLLGVNVPAALTCPSFWSQLAEALPNPWDSPFFAGVPPKSWHRGMSWARSTGNCAIGGGETAGAGEGDGYGPAAPGTVMGFGVTPATGLAVGGVTV